MFGLRYLKNVTTLKLDRSLCNGCGICIIVCPHSVFRLSDKKAAIINRDSCMECGACAQNCQDKALTVKAGVGCAYGIIMGKLRGTEPTCGCDDTPSCC